MTPEERIEQLEAQVEQLSAVCVHLFAAAFGSLDKAGYPQDSEEAAVLALAMAAHEIDQGNHIAADLYQALANKLRPA